MGLITNLLACILATKEERQFNAQVRKDGLEIALNRCLDEINRKIPSTELAIKFVLQELDFGEKERILPPDFILNSGFHQLEYQDASNRFKESEVELRKIQTISDNFLRNIKNEKEMVESLTTIIEEVIYQWEIGKYSPARVEEITEPKVEINEEKNIISEDIEEPKPIQYDSDRVNHLMEEYSDIIGDIIIGAINSKEERRIEEFKEHISRAGVEGESPHALVLGCFYEHKEPYNTQLPIKMSEMSGTSLKFFMSILEGFAKQGYSQPFLAYMEKYRDDFNLLIQKER